jgi:D-amino peptidase
MAGTYGALLDHSMSSKRIQNYRINGKAAGETAIDAGIAGDKGLPVIMVTGDDLLCKEAKTILPWVVTCEVKTSASTYGAQMFSKDESQFIIKEKTLEAIKRYHEMKPLIYNKPITLRVEVTERNALPDTYAKPYMRILDGRTFEVTGNTVEEALYRQY